MMRDKTMRRHAKARPPQPAFTLIELLVVIAVIAVLLALLTPALDMAVYQAELTVCGSKLHAVGQGVLGYAVERRRRYPPRLGVEAGKDWQPRRISDGAGWDRTGGADDRAVLRGLFPLNPTLNCPLNGQVDIEGSREDTWIYGSYALWFGWRYRGGSAMRRIGDRLAWDSTRFALLSGDMEAIRPAYMNGTHPDRAGRLANVKLQDEPANTTGLAAGDVTVSWWQMNDYRRSPMDRNFVYDDGSVRRVDAVEVDDGTGNVADERMGSVPVHTRPESDGGWPTKRTLVPRT